VPGGLIQRAEQRHREAVRAPVAVGGAHLDTDQLLLRFEAGVLEPGNGITKGVFEAGVTVVQLPMWLETSIDQSVGPLHRHLHYQLLEWHPELTARPQPVFDPTVLRIASDFFSFRQS